MDSYILGLLEIYWESLISYLLGLLRGSSVRVPLALPMQVLLVYVTLG